MPVVLHNFAGSKTTAILGTATTVIPVLDISVFPTLAANEYFYALLMSPADLTTKELVKVTAVSGSNLTVVRAQEGTTAQNFPIGSIIELRLTRASMNEWVVTSTEDSTYVNDTGRPASTSWVRRALGAITSSLGFAASLSLNGYLKLPSYLGSFIFQWGFNSVTASGYKDVTYPIAFPNDVYCNLAIATTSGTTNGDRFMSVEDTSVSSLTLARFTMMKRSGSNGTGNFYWFAIGY